MSMPSQIITDINDIVSGNAERGPRKKNWIDRVAKYG